MTELQIKELNNFIKKNNIIITHSFGNKFMEKEEAQKHFEKTMEFLTPERRQKIALKITKEISKVYLKIEKEVRDFETKFGVHTFYSTEENGKKLIIETILDEVTFKI